MIRRHLRSIVGLSVFLLLTVAVTGCGPAATPVALEATPDNAVYLAAIRDARTAFQAGEFEQAMKLARQAATLHPAENTAWVLYQEAAVDLAADTYLRTLPPDRYRMTPDGFVADQVNGRHFLILDVREPDEFAESHIEGAINIPLRQLVRRLGELPGSRATPIVVYCHSQKRSTHALVILRELGYTQVYNLAGGYAGYQEWVQTHSLPTPGPTPTPEPEGPGGC